MLPTLVPLGSRVGGHQAEKFHSLQLKHRGAAQHRLKEYMVSHRKKTKQRYSY